MGVILDDNNSAPYYKDNSHNKAAVDDQAQLRDRVEEALREAELIESPEI